VIATSRASTALNSTERTAADSTLFRTSNGTKSKNTIDCVPKELVQDNRNIKSDVEISFENVIEGIENEDSEEEEEEDTVGKEEFRKKPLTDRPTILQSFLSRPTSASRRRK